MTYSIQDRSKYLVRNLNIDNPPEVINAQFNVKNIIALVWNFNIANPLKCNTRNLKNNHFWCFPLMCSTNRLLKIICLKRETARCFSFDI